MGALLESGMVGNIGLKHLKVIKEDTIKKWNELGFLEGLDGHNKDNIAQLYENQATYLINEAATSDASGSFETVVFPIIRRVFSKLLANDIVSVQAMNLPIGKLFFFIPKIQDRDVNGNHYPKFGYPNPAADPSQGYGNSRSLYDRFYEESDAASEGLFDYSKGNYDEIPLNVTGFVTFDKGVESAPVATISDADVSNVIIKVTGLSTDGQGKMIGANGNIMDTEDFLASLEVMKDGVSLPINVVTQKYGKGIVAYGKKAGTGMNKFYDVCDEAGNIYLSVDVETYSPTAGYQKADYSVDNLVVADLTVKYRSYDTLEFENEIGEVSFDLESVTVSVTGRKLRATWSPELAQDVSAFHNIDAEAELTALLSEQIAAEVDREILRDLRKGAAWKAKWDYNEWRYGNGGTAFQGYTQKDWNQTLITKINQVSAQIHKTTLRGGANWIVVSSEVSAVFDDLEYFHVSNAGS